MSTPTLNTPTVDQLRRLVGHVLPGHRTDMKSAPGSVDGCTAGKVAWYHGGPDGQLHAVAVWAPGESGWIEALCSATSWGWCEADRDTSRNRCSTCATAAFGMPLLNPRP